MTILFRGRRFALAAVFAGLASAAVLPASDLRFAARLTLPDGAPAAGYAVSVVGRPISAVCAADGSFTLDPAPNPPFQLVAAGPGGEVSGTLEIADLGATELQLPAVIQDSITVVSGVAPSLDALPGNAATLVGVEELEQRAPERLVNTLESVPGASTRGDGVDAVPALRNLGRGRTLILVDGTRVTAERRAGPSATFIEPNALSSIEVLRGPGSVVYGSDAFGGVINALTRDPEGQDFSAHVEAEGSGGALDQQAFYASASLGFGDNVRLLVSGNVADADDAEAGDGVPIDNSSYESSGAGLRLVHDAVGNGRLRLSYNWDRNEDLGKAAIDSNVTRAIYPEEESDRLTASWIGSAGSWDSLEATFFYGQYAIILDRDRLPAPGVTRRIDTSDTDSDDASLRLVGGRELAGGHFQVGFDGHSRFNLTSAVTRRSFNAAGNPTTAVTTPSIDDAQQQTLGVFGTWNKPVSDWVSLGLGLRADRIETRNRGGFYGDRDDEQSPVSGNVALTVGPFSNTTATLQYARGFRTPSLSDRYFRGPSGRGFAVGNPDLEPEESEQIDLSVRYGKGRTAVAVYLYDYQIDDLIERYAVGDNFQFRNRGSAKIRGGELEVQHSMGPWSGELGIAIADGETDGNAEIDDIAAPNAFVTVRRSFERFYGFARVTAYQEKDDPGPTEDIRPSFTIVDVGAGFRFTERFELRAVVRNLGDKLYFAAPDEAADRAVGRSVTVGLSGRF